MKKSYQILEPEVLEKLFNYKKYSLNITNSLLSWFSYKLSNELSKRKINVEIDVVKVKYQS